MRARKNYRLHFTALLFCLLAAFPARAEMVRELVSVENAMPIPVSGTGIITGLANTGDRSRGALELLRKYLSNKNFDFDATSLALGNIALVHISGDLMPFSRAGSKFSVNVTSWGDAKSLKGGTLLAADLFAGDELVARANGPVMVGENNLLRGKISGGALQLVNFPFGEIMNPKSGIIRLNLNQNSFKNATTIARQINQTPSLNPYLRESVMFADAAPSQPIAYAKDPGQVLVWVPPQFRKGVTAYVSDILAVPVAVDTPARIVVNRAKNTIVVTGDVRVNNATISIQDKTVTITPETPEEPARYTLENVTPRTLVEVDGPGTYADLQGILDTLNSMGLTTDQVITVFEQLVASGATNATLVSE